MNRFCGKDCCLRTHHFTPFSFLPVLRQSLWRNFPRSLFADLSPCWFSCKSPCLCSGEGDLSLFLPFTGVIASFLFMLLVGPHAARIFIKPGDTELLKVSVTAIRIFSFSYLVGWIDMCFSSYFTALDCPVRSLLVSFFGTLVFPIAFLHILTAFWGLNGVWLMASAAAVASGVLTLILAKTMKLESAPDTRADLSSAEE